MNLEKYSMDRVWSCRPFRLRIVFGVIQTTLFPLFMCDGNESTKPEDNRLILLGFYSRNLEYKCLGVVVSIPIDLRLALCK